MIPSPHLCPDHIKESIDRYVSQGVPPSDFLYNVLTNNLKEAIAHADEDNLDVLPHIVAYLHNEIPFPCWGTPEKVALWLKAFRDRDEPSA